MCMSDGRLRTRRMVVHNVRCPAIGHDYRISMSRTLLQRLTLSVQWKINRLNPAIRAKYLPQVCLRYVLGELFHHNFRALYSSSARRPAVAAIAI